MNTERDKFLTEAMGECWHVREGQETIPEHGDTPYHVCKCGKRLVFYDVSEMYNYDFSTWRGFGRLWEWSQSQDWWDKFTFCKSGQINMLICSQINPDWFADTVYAYLKEAPNA